MVRHFDQQLSMQFKDRDFVIKKIWNEDDTSKDDFYEKVNKLEAQGLLRNRSYFEFIDNKGEFNEAKKLFNDETWLALKDGLLTDIDNWIHSSSG